jgi:hypothetical protein
MVLLSAIAYRACTVTLTLGCLLVCYRLCNAFRDSLVPFTHTVHSLVLAFLRMPHQLENTRFSYKGTSYTGCTVLQQFSQNVQALFVIILGMVQHISTPQADRMVLLSAIYLQVLNCNLLLGCLLASYRLCNAFRDSLSPFTHTAYRLLFSIPAGALFNLKNVCFSYKRHLLHRLYLLSQISQKVQAFVLLRVVQHQSTHRPAVHDFTLLLPDLFSFTA